MLTILSPSKTQDFSLALRGATSLPRFENESKILLKELQKLSADELESLMQISPKLALLNQERFAKMQFPFDEKNSKQAFWAFRGDVYDGLNADSFSDADIIFAQKHIRMLSGFYGILRPCDLIQPYRLEMKTALKNPRGKNLYEFWGNQLTEILEKDAANMQEKVLINLASEEYAKAAQLKKINLRVITPIFKEQKGDKYVVTALFAKKARGMAANFIIKNQIVNPEHLKTFSEAGYFFSEKLSDKNEWIFVR